MGSHILVTGQCLFAVLHDLPCIFANHGPDYFIVNVLGNIMRMPQRFIYARANMPTDCPSVMADALRVVVDGPMESHFWVVCVFNT